jgi:hypothetical protein
MERRYLWTLPLLAMLPCLGTSVGWAQSVPANDDARCQALARVDFSNIADAPAQITEAKVAKDVRGLLGEAEVNEALAKAVGHVQPMCRVSGYVTPNVGFVLLLPVSQWNGKFLHVGCGGWCGSTAFVPISCALHAGYACVGTDMGHTGGGGLWSRNNLQAQIDFGYRATHVATLAAKAILGRFYSTEPNKSYFMGCSTGG